MHENYHTAGLSCQMDNVSFGNFKAAVKNGAVNLQIRLPGGTALGRTCVPHPVL